MTERVLVALGSNVGSRESYLANARAALALLPVTQLLATSRVEETAPFGSGAQGPYLNQMVLMTTLLTPPALLNVLQRIERALGRVRARRWGARTIDLDIVRFGDVSMKSRRLELPHPGIRDRDFWRRELAELAELQAVVESAA